MRLQRTNFVVLVLVLVNQEFMRSENEDEDKGSSDLCPPTFGLRPPTSVL
jgi:hypothetical protein